MRRKWIWGLVVVAMGLGLALGAGATAQDSDTATKAKKKKPAEVNLVQSVPIEVTATAAPLPVAVSTLPAVDVSTLPPVSVSSMPAVAVSSLPPVAVSSMPAVTIANSPLNVNVVNSSIATSPPTNATVTVSDLNGVTVSSNFTSTAVIDCSGYRSLSVFLSHDTYSGSTVTFAAEFGCGGIWAWDGGDSGNFGIPPTSSRPVVWASDVLGPQVRIRMFTSITVTNVKVVVYLRR